MHSDHKTGFEKEPHIICINKIPISTLAEHQVTVIKKNMDKNIPVYNSIHLWITTDCIRQTTSTLMQAICNELILFLYQNNIGQTGYFVQFCALCAEGWDG